MSSYLEIYLTANSPGYIFRKMRSLPGVKILTEMQLLDLVDKYNQIADAAVGNSAMEAEAASVIAAVTMKTDVSVTEFLEQTNPMSGLWLGSMRQEAVFRSGSKNNYIGKADQNREQVAKMHVASNTSTSILKNNDKTEE